MAFLYLISFPGTTVRSSLFSHFIERHRLKKESFARTSYSSAGIDDSLTSVICFEFGLPPTGIVPKLISSPSILIFGIIILAFIEMNIFLPPLTIMVRPESITCYFGLMSFTLTSAISSAARMVFEATIFTSYSISLFGTILKIVKFFEEFLMENFI